MKPIELKDVAEIISSVDAFSIFRDFEKWRLWLSDPMTKKFIDFIIARRIELQNEITSQRLDSKENVAKVQEKKGGFDELGNIIETFNQFYEKKGE